MIADKLNELYSAQAAEEAKKPWYPRPSGLGGCLREFAWLLSGAEAEPRTPESMRLLELGHQRGQELALRIKAAFPDAVICDCNSPTWDCLPTCSTTVSIPVPWGAIPGHFDAWIPSLRTIVDFKTAGAYSMGLIVNGEKEDEGYALQLNAYRHGIASREQPLVPHLALGPEDIRTVLVYEAKDSDARKGVTAGMLHEVEIPYTAELEARYQARLNEINLLLKLDPLDPTLIAGMPSEKGKPHWRCATFKDGRPKYCSVGPIRGSCGS